MFNYQRVYPIVSYRILLDPITGTSKSSNSKLAGIYGIAHHIPCYY